MPNFAKILKDSFIHLNENKLKSLTGKTADGKIDEANNKYH